MIWPMIKDPEGSKKKLPRRKTTTCEFCGGWVRKQILCPEILAKRCTMLKTVQILNFILGFYFFVMYDHEGDFFFSFAKLEKT